MVQLRKFKHGYCWHGYIQDKTQGFRPTYPLAALLLPNKISGAPALYLEVLFKLSCNEWHSYSFPFHFHSLGHQDPELIKSMLECKWCIYCIFLFNPFILLCYFYFFLFWYSILHWPEKHCSFIVYLIGMTIKLLFCSTLTALLINSLVEKKFNFFKKRQLIEKTKHLFCLKGKKWRSVFKRYFSTGCSTS